MDEKVSDAEGVKEMGGALAKLMAQQVAPYPAEVQMVAAQLFIESMVVVHVKPTKRVEFAGKLMRDVVGQIRDHGKRPQS